MTCVIKAETNRVGEVNLPITESQESRKRVDCCLDGAPVQPVVGQPEYPSGWSRCHFQAVSTIDSISLNFTFQPRSCFALVESA